MTIIKITGYDLLYNCSEVSKTQFFILNTNNGRYRLIFAHLYDNLYGLDEVIDNETDIIYDDKSEHSIKDFLLLSPMGYGNILPLKVVPYENGIMVFCDEMIYLENERTAYFYSAKKEVFMVTNYRRKYLVEILHQGWRNQQRTGYANFGQHDNRRSFDYD